MAQEYQNILIIIVASSAALQAAAAVLTLRLNRFATRRHGWTLISLAIFCMFFRRLLELQSLTNGQAAPTSTNLWQEAVALITSGLILAGLVLLREMFQSMRDSHLALRQSEKRYRDIFEQSNDGIVVSGLDGKVLDMNLAGRKMFGVVLDGSVSFDMKDLYVDPADRLNLLEIIGKYGYCRDFATRMNNADGRIMECELSVCMRVDEADGPNGFLTIVRDVTRRRVAEAELHEKNNTLDAILASSPVGIFLVREEKVAWVNSAMVRMLGYEGEQIMGMAPLDFWKKPELYRKAARKALGDMALVGSAIIDTEMKKGDGSKFDAFLQLRPLDVNQPSNGYIGCVSDVTERKQAAEKIRKSEARYRLVLENANVATFILQDGKINFCNEKAGELLGMSQSDVLNKPWRSLVSELCAKSLLRDIEPVVRAGHKFGPKENRIDLVNGRQLLLEFTVTPVAYEEKPAILAFAQDMTTQRRLERQLQQSQKMEALGRLAAGVAHDFNNLIMVVGNYSQMALMHPDCTSDLKGLISEIDAASNRALNLTEKLSMFSRQEITPPNLLNLNNVINDMYGMVKPLLKPNISLEVKLSPRLWNIQGDRGELEQVLMNLAVNANDAMENGGLLTILTENFDTRNGDELFVPELAPGKYVLLSIGDSGCGMDPETAARIFEPFFSTKGMGKGTGLGLSIVYGIVKKLEGLINVESSLDLGTKIDIYIPKAGEIVALPDEQIQASSISLRSN